MKALPPLDKGPSLGYKRLAGEVRPCAHSGSAGVAFWANGVKFHDYCNELQRRLPIAIEAFRLPFVDTHVLIGIYQDPAGIQWNCALTLESLIEVETALAARARALKMVTVH